MSDLLAKLGIIQNNLKAPKSLRNNFGNYNYRSAESILEAVKPLIAEHKLVLLISDEVVAVEDRVYVKAKVELFDAEADSPSIMTYGYAREEETKKGMDQSQITGAASSYARKYALNGLFAIDDGVDADSQNKHGKEPPKKGKAPAAAKKDLTPSQLDQAIKQVEGSNIATLPQIEQKVENKYNPEGANAKKLKKVIENKYNSMKEK
jgi:hypothetical protein